MAGSSWWAQFIDELRSALRPRIVAQHPGFALAVIVSLGVGVSAAAGVFAVVESAKHGTLPFANAERVERVYLSTGAGDEHRTWEVAPSVVRAFMGGSSPAVDVAAYQLTSVHTRQGDHEDDVWSARMTNNLPALIGARAELGRFFLPGELAVVLSHDQWQSDFAGTPDIIGRTIEIDHIARTIVGVASPATSFPDRRVMWVSGLELNSLDERKARVGALVLLPRNVDPAEMRPRIATLGTAALAQSATGKDLRIASVSFREYLVTGQLKTIVLFFTIIAILVGFIAAVNFAALTLARGIRRRGELGVRAALGASVGRLTRHIIGESLLLCGIGGVLAALLAPVVANVMRTTFANLLPEWLDITIGWRTVFGSMLVAVIFGIVFGLGPALDLARPALRSFLNGAGGTIADGAGLARTRSWLVGIQVALASAVLVALGALFGRTLVMSDPKPGFGYTQVVRAVVRDTARSDWQMTHRDELLVGEAMQTPGVAAAAVRTSQYLNRAGVYGETRDGPRSWEGNGYFWIDRISDGFFDVVRPTLVAGRLPTAEEIRAGASVAVVPRSTADGLFGGDAVGHRVRAGNDPDDAAVVIGVIEDVRDHAVEATVQPRVFIPLRTKALDGARFFPELWVRSAVPVPSTVRALSQHLTRPRVGMDLFALEGLPASFARELQAFRKVMRIVLGIFGIALGLAAIGIYGLVAYTAEMRSRELAIREALGASRIQVAGRVLRGALVQSACGVLAGSLLATWMIEQINHYNTKITPAAGASAAAFGLVSLVVLVSSFGPIRTAWRRDLAWALRAGD